MKVAALYDIHGNLPALEAVLQDIRREGVDQIVVGGDVVPGPMSRETLALLLDLDFPTQFIQGNCEHEVLSQMAGIETGNLPVQFRESFRWVAQQIPPEYERRMAEWPLTLSLDITGIGAALFCHATPRNNTEVFTRLTPEDRLLPVFENVDAALVVCGHTHMQFDRRIGAIRVVNAGSVGAPYGVPGAYWLLLGPDVQLRYTSYNVKLAAERIRQTSYPNADHCADNQVLHPLSEAEWLDIITRMEL
jgi:putative phosphoesterase